MTYIPNPIVSLIWIEENWSTEQKNPKLYKDRSFYNIALQFKDDFCLKRTKIRSSRIEFVFT